MRILWAAYARENLISIRQYIAEHNPAAAKAIAGKIVRSAGLLCEQPDLGLATHR